MPDVQALTLEWKGPLTDCRSLPDTPGLYAMTGRVYGGGEDTRLLYIGLAGESLRARWKSGDHRDWLVRSVTTLGAKLYFTTASAALVDVLETILIYVHQPNQNSQKINSSLPRQHYIIHNTGAVPEGLLTDVDTAEPWFGIQPVPVD